MLFWFLLLKAKEWEEAIFAAPSYSSTNIGGALPAGSILISDNKITFTGGGSTIGGTADQFNFSYQLVTDDFDVGVRIESFQAADIWAKAGLMARETLDPGSKFAAVLATPSLNGAFMTYRSATNGQAIVTGSFPLNYPYLWLRLKRASDVFSAYASCDGKQWSLLGRTNILMASRIYLGFAISSANQGTQAVAVFRDLSTIIKPHPAILPPRFEPLGQTTRRTGLVISEIMYNPFSPGPANYEFVELFNSAGTPEEIGSYRLGGDIIHFHRIQ